MQEEAHIGRNASRGGGGACVVSPVFVRSREKN